MKDLTNGNIYKTFIVFAIPLVLSGLLSQAYGIIDTMIAGKFLGSEGIAAIGSTYSFTEFLSGIFWGFSAGSSIFFARLFGAKDYRQMRVSICSNCIVMAIAIVVLSVIAIIFTKPVFAFLKVDEALSADAAIYYSIYTAGLVFMIFTNCFVHIMNAVGISAYPLKMSIISTILNISGNIISVTVFKLGVAGLALSSVLSAFVVDACYFFKLKKCFRELKLSKKDSFFDIVSVKRAMRFSLPCIFQQSAMYFTSFIISPLVNGISASATAAYSVILKIYSINSNIYQNSSKALSTYTAQCVGAGKLDQLNRGVRVGFLQANLFLLPVLVLCMSFAHKICASFFPGRYSGDALNFSIIFVRYYLPFIVFNLVNNLFHAFYRGVGAMGFLLVVTCLGGASRIVFSWIFTPMQGIGGIYLAMVLSWIFEAVITAGIYLSGAWKKSLI